MGRWGAFIGHVAPKTSIPGKWGWPSQFMLNLLINILDTHFRKWGLFIGHVAPKNSIRGKWAWPQFILNPIISYTSRHNLSFEPFDNNKQESTIVGGEKNDCPLYKSNFLHELPPFCISFDQDFTS
jgi:hypothetical protein